MSGTRTPTNSTTKSQRGSILLEESRVVGQQYFDGDQVILTVQAPTVAATATPGQFAHIQCGPDLPMRRPLSIMRVLPDSGEVMFLYKVVGLGTRQLAQRKAGEYISLLGPIGKGFTLEPERDLPLLIGGGVGIPPMLFLADQIRQTAPAYDAFVIMGSEVPFPFQSVASQFSLPWLDADINAAMPLLEEWRIAGRLASKQGYPGCFDGYVTELAALWLATLDEAQRQRVQIYSCGPHPMLAAVARLAADNGLPCQVSLEEYMACAVGGCAGCVVSVRTADGPAMKRVCVDGPVFDAQQVFDLHG